MNVLSVHTHYVTIFSGECICSKSKLHKSVWCITLHLLAKEEHTSYAEVLFSTIACWILYSVAWSLSGIRMFFSDCCSCLRYMGSTIIMEMKEKCLGLLKVLEIIHFCEVIDCRKSRLQRQKAVCSAWHHFLL